MRNKPACVHLQPYSERVERDPAREGWQKVFCSKCGRFIGYRDLGHYPTQNRLSK